MRPILALVSVSTVMVLIEATTISLIDGRNQTYVNLNENVEISCVAADLGGKTVRWTHNDKQIALVAGGQTIVYMDPEDEAKYTLIGDDVNGGNFTLIIRQFTVGDVGTVTCDVNGVPPVTQQVDIFQKPTHFFLTYQSDGPVYEMYTSSLQHAFYIGIEQDINITCLSLNTRPVAKLRWLTDQEDYIVMQTKEEIMTAGNLFNATRTVIFSASNYLHFRDTLSTTPLSDIEIPTASSTDNMTTNTPNSSYQQTTTAHVVDLWLSLICEANIDENGYLLEVSLHIGEYPTAFAMSLHDRNGLFNFLSIFALCKFAF